MLREYLKCGVFVFFVVILGDWLMLDISCKRSLKGKSQARRDRTKQAALDICSDTLFNIKQYA